MPCGNSVTSDYIQNLLVGKDFKSRYFDGAQTNGLYGLDLFLNFYQNNVNSAAGVTDLNATANFVRNPNCWASDIDLTCCSPWNMHPTLRLAGDVLPSSSQHMAGTLISRRHVIFAKHFCPPAGSLIRFVTRDNQTVTKTVTAVQTVAAGDFAVGVLDSDVPLTITFARILPDNWRDKFAMAYTPSGSIDFAYELLGISLNQDKSVVLRQIQIPLIPQTLDENSVNVLTSNLGPVDARRNLRLYDSGSPTFLIVDNTPIIVTTFLYVNYGNSIYACRHAINDAMLLLGGGYTLTPANLDAYSAFLSAVSGRGRAGVGVVQPQSGLDYPLVAPTEDVRYLIADFYLSYDDTGEYSASVAPAAHPLRVKYLYGIGCIENTPAAGFPTNVHAADIVVVDSNNRVVLDTNSAAFSFNVQPWSDDYKIYEWKSSTAVCRLVAYTTWPADDSGYIDGYRRNYSKSLTPVNAKLDERAVYKMPRRLLSVRVRNGQTTTGRYRGKLTFANGNNSTITPAPVAESSFRYNTNMLFAAVAGSGSGKWGGCGVTPTELPITAINGVSGVFGDFLISGTDCLWARRPVSSLELSSKLLAEDSDFFITEETDFSYLIDEAAASNAADAEYAVSPSTTAHQQIGADCNPCCACDDYADAAKYLNDTSYRYRLIGQRAERVRTEHENNVTRWADQRACSVQRPLRLLMIPQRCPFMDIVMLLCNPCRNCIDPSLISVTISIAGATGVTVIPAIVPGYTELNAPGINNGVVRINASTNGLTYSTTLPQLKAGESAYAKFRLRFDQVAVVEDDAFAIVKARGQYAITGTLTGSLLKDGSAILTNCGDNLNDGAAPPPASAETTRILSCTTSGTTIVPQ